MTVLTPIRFTAQPYPQPTRPQFAAHSQAARDEFDRGVTEKFGSPLALPPAFHPPVLKEGLDEERPLLEAALQGVLNPEKTAAQRRSALGKLKKEIAPLMDGDGHALTLARLLVRVRALTQYFSDSQGHSEALPDDLLKDIIAKVATLAPHLSSVFPSRQPARYTGPVFKNPDTETAFLKLFLNNNHSDSAYTSASFTGTLAKSSPENLLLVLKEAKSLGEGLCMELMQAQLEKDPNQNSEVFRLLEQQFLKRLGPPPKVQEFYATSQTALVALHWLKEFRKAGLAPRRVIRELLNRAFPEQGNSNALATPKANAGNFRSMELSPISGQEALLATPGFTSDLALEAEYLTRLMKNTQNLELLTKIWEHIQTLPSEKPSARPLEVATWGDSPLDAEPKTGLAIHERDVLKGQFIKSVMAAVDAFPIQGPKHDLGLGLVVDSAPRFQQMLLERAHEAWQRLADSPAPIPERLSQFLLRQMFPGKIVTTAPYPPK